MRTPHILVVDDDLYIVQRLKAYLETQGCRVTSANGSPAAMDELRKNDKVDLVILDYLMMDGPGTDLLRLVGEDPYAQKPPVIMASTILDPCAPRWESLLKTLPQDSQSLIKAYVTKPYADDAMDIAMHEVLGGDYLPEPRTTTRQPQRAR